MNIPTTDIISDIRTGKAKMEREGDTWTDTEKYDLLLQYFAGIDITDVYDTRLYRRVPYVRRWWV